ncbi:hypothetical protein MCAP1_003394 [Malassezia caprae]|uniref:Fatty acid hydroxylase domain-containing protein n=1 Tax=Malassezia caprae TaxID=1381934 RepID=A0AAF0EEP5_9BASI|nr:hypothetical protein MCAP1_003394 [Malassezia caprae]
MDRSYSRSYADDWRFKPPSQLSLVQRILVHSAFLAPSPRTTSFPQPTGKVPVVREWQMHRAIFPWAFAPVLMRWALQHYVQWTVPSIVMYLFLAVYYTIYVGRHLTMLHDLSCQYGFFDGGAVRDRISTDMAPRVLYEAVLATLLRPLVLIAFTYDQHKTMEVSPWLPVKLFFFTLIADFVYYWMHRATHEFDTLWHLHRLHHTLKHPSPSLLGFADGPQEIFDIIGTMTLAYLVYPMSFDEMQIWLTYLITMEASGHSGVRVFMPGCLTSTPLRFWDCDLALEDHDLHHRHGWRVSFNYGKQSRLWDAIFGTQLERVEGTKNNLDWSAHVAL